MLECSKSLKDYKGFHIYKDYSLCNKKQYNIVYHAYDSKSNYLDSKKDLKELKKVIDKYSKL